MKKSKKLNGELILFIRQNYGPKAASSMQGYDWMRIRAGPISKIAYVVRIQLWGEGCGMYSYESIRRALRNREGAIPESFTAPLLKRLFCISVYLLVKNRKYLFSNALFNFLHLRFHVFLQVA